MKSLKTTLQILLYILSCVGTLTFVGLLWIASLGWSATKTKDNTQQELLPSGVFYRPNPDVYGGKILIDGAGHTLVPEDVDFFKVDGSFFYGRRLGLDPFDRHYFLCEAGKDCRHTQNYNEEYLQKILVKKGLRPLFLASSDRAEAQ